MRIKKNLLTPAVLLTVVCLFLAAGGTAEAAELLGIQASDLDDLMGTAKIRLIDTSSGTSLVLADTGLSRVSEASDPTALNGIFGPNDLAFNSKTDTAYFASSPNSAGGPPVLYSVKVDPPGMPMDVGNPDGANIFDAAFFDGKYWYISAETDDLHSISFDPMGMIATEVVVDLLAAGMPEDAMGLSVLGHTLGFGDIAIKFLTDSETGLAGRGR